MFKTAAGACVGKNAYGLIVAGLYICQMNKKLGGIVVTALLVIGVMLLNRREVLFQGQDNFVLKKISSTGYELQSVIKLKNNNLLSSTIQNLDEKFYLNDTLIFIMHMELQQGIPGMKETTFPIMVRFNMDSLSEFDTFNIRAEGNADYKNFTGGGNLQLKAAATVKLNTLLK